MVVNLSVVIKKIHSCGTKIKKELQKQLGDISGPFYHHRNQISMNLFDKSYISPFSIVGMSPLISRRPSKLFQTRQGAEILRSATVTCTKTKYINHCSTLVSRVTKQERNINTIPKTLSKKFGLHFDTSLRHHQNSQELFTLETRALDFFFFFLT